MPPRNALARHRFLAAALIVAAAVMGYFLGGESVPRGAPQDVSVVRTH